MVPAYPKRLPIYRVAPAAFDDSRIGALLRDLNLADAPPPVTLPDGGRHYENGPRIFEISNDGSYWFADRSRLWNPNAPVEALPGPDAAAGQALSFLSRFDLLPRSSNGARIAAPIVTNAGSIVARARRQGNQIVREPCARLDSYVGVGPRIEIDAAGGPIGIDVIGPGGKVGITFGGDGAVIGLNAGWRQIERQVERVPVLPPPAPEALATQDRSTFVDAGSARLVYRVVALPDTSRLLAPFWLFHVFFEAEGTYHRSVDRLVPATRFPLPGDPQLPITYRARQPESMPTIGTAKRALGASWVTNTNTSSESEVAALLIEALKHRGRWDFRFHWRDRDAWESDWSACAADWADSVDLAFYAGHAYRNGWLLKDRDSGDRAILHTDTVGSLDPRNRIWSRRLRWILLGACGPLQDGCVIPKDGDVFEWAGAFDGLRLIAGFATSTSGFTGEAARALALATRGSPIAPAWLRAARETQPLADRYVTDATADGRWAAVLGIEDENGSSFDDRLDVETTRSPTPASDRFIAMWSPT